jgi:hypothetical protein
VLEKESFLERLKQQTGANPGKGLNNVSGLAFSGSYYFVKVVCLVNKPKEMIAELSNANELLDSLSSLSWMSGLQKCESRVETVRRR